MLRVERRYEGLNLTRSVTNQASAIFEQDYLARESSILKNRVVQANKEREVWKPASKLFVFERKKDEDGNLVMKFSTG